MDRILYQRLRSAVVSVPDYEQANLDSNFSLGSQCAAHPSSFIFFYPRWWINGSLGNLGKLGEGKRGDRDNSQASGNSPTVGSNGHRDGDKHRRHAQIHPIFTFNSLPVYVIAFRGFLCVVHHGRNSPALGITDPWLVKVDVL